MKLGKSKKNIEDKKTFFSGSWKEVELLGEGSYGRVYKAKKEEFGAVSYCAIKQIEIPKEKAEINTLKKEGMTSSDITSYFKDTVTKWVDEINFMSTFKDNENVVSIEDYEILPKNKEIGWIINIKMELLTNFEDYIYKNNITDKEVLKMAIDVCNALIDCEENNVVHRDIKPDNIFVNKKGIYKVGDFGIAKKIETSASNMSKKGTDNYMAPELYKNERGNKTVDIYSLGIMLYRFFNYNRLPFLPDYPDKITPESRENALYMRISGEKMKPPVNATREIAEIILKACNYYSKDRYLSASELKEELEKVYREITKPKTLFNYNEKQMNKLYKENTKSDTHNTTISVLTGTNTEIIDNSSNKIEEVVIEPKIEKSAEKVEEPVIEVDKENIKEESKNKIEDSKEEIKENIEAISKEIKKEPNEDSVKELEEKPKENIVKEDNKKIQKEEIIKEEVKKDNKKIKKEKVRKEKNKDAIKSKNDIKIKNNKPKIIVLIILLLVTLLMFLAIFLKPKKEEYITVPNVIKMESTAGSELLTKEGFIVEYEYEETENEEEVNHIISQSVDAETKTKKGTLIRIKVAVSKEKVELINVVGMTKEEAIKELENLGLKVSITEQNSDDIEKDKVISQMTEAGSKVNKGTIIELLISKGVKEKNETKNETKKQEQKSTTKQSNWSSWVEVLPNGVTSSSYNIETKKQYRSSKRETTSSTDANLSGWTKYDEKTEYEYGTVVGEVRPIGENNLNQYLNDPRYKVVSQELYAYWVDSRYCRDENDPDNISKFSYPPARGYCPNSPTSYKSYEVSNKPEVDSVITVYDKDYKADIKIRVMEVKTVYKVLYCRAIKTTTTYYYEKWSGWSSWQDSAISSSDSVKVEERTLYRYKEK